MMNAGQFDRRVGAAEFMRVLDCGPTWFDSLVARGIVPRGRVDPGGKKRWWLASEVQATLDAMAKAAARARADLPLPTPARKRKIAAELPRAAMTTRAASQGDPAPAARRGR